MLELKAPISFKKELETFPYSIFLTGSIEMGKAENWQDKTVRKLKDKNILILNPRRDDWDSSWVQSIHNKQFNEQVNWELTGQQECDLIFMYFDPKTKSPITLLELGLFAKDNKVIVCCPEGYWRKGNIEVVCNRYIVPLYENLDKAIEELISRINKESRR